MTKEEMCEIEGCTNEATNNCLNCMKKLCNKHASECPRKCCGFDFTRYDWTGGER